MASLGYLIHNITGRKELETALPAYRSRLMQISGRLSAVRFVLNYTTFYDSLYDAKKDAAEEAWLPEVIHLAIVRLNELVKMQNIAEAAEAETAVETLRGHMMEIVGSLSSLSDRYMMFEYIMNRKEALFTEAVLPDGYSDDDMTDRLMNWLRSDQNLMYMRLSQMVEQLPMRMTKNRFFQVLENGLSVYKESEKKSLDGVLDMIRSSVMPSEPEGVQRNFPQLSAMMDELEATDFEQADMAVLREAHAKMLRIGTYLNDMLSITFLLTQLVNDEYVQILSGTFEEKTEEQAVIAEIIDGICPLFADGYTAPISEAVFQKFERLEGKQEALHEAFQEGIYALQEVKEACGADIVKMGLEEDFHKLYAIAQLLSDSLFASLKEETDGAELCGQAYVRETYAKLYQELTALFAHLPRYRVRGLMSKILTFLPPFLLSEAEIRDYIRTSLSGCKDMAEKVASIEILESLIAES